MFKVSETDVIHIFILVPLTLLPCTSSTTITNGKFNNCSGSENPNTHTQTTCVCVCGFNYVRQTERGHMSTSLDTCVGKSIWVNLVVLLFVFHDFVVKQTTATTTDYLCKLDINHFHHQTKHRTSLQK